MATTVPDFVLAQEQLARTDASNFMWLVKKKIYEYSNMHRDSNKTLPTGPNGPSIKLAMHNDRQRLRQMGGGPDGAISPAEWELAAVTIAYAVLNPVHLNVEAERLAMRGKRVVLPEPRPLIQEPCVLVDIGGRIIAWILPGILAPWRQDAYYSAHQPFSKAVPPAVGKGWRRNKKNLRPPTTTVCKAGTMDFSVGWQQAGHNAPEHSIHFSLSLLVPPAVGWLKSIQPGERLVNAVTAAIHPDLFACLLNGMRATAVLPGFKKHRWVHEVWPTLFGGLSTVTNRISPSHREDKSPDHGYDILSTHGIYRSGKLSFPELNVTVAYNPGGLFAFSGSLLKHECVNWNRGLYDRICYARWMRDTVHEALRIPRCQWSMYSTYEAYINSSYKAFAS